MVQALISIDFLKNFQKFDSFKISDFKESAEIDIESFMFINQLLFTNKSSWAINLKVEKIAELIGLPIHEIPEIDYEAAIIIKGFGQNKIESAYDLYYKIQREEYALIDKSVLPHYVFLGNIGPDICKRIEDTLGIICISINTMKIKMERRQVVLKTVANTQSALFSLLSNLPYNYLSIEDSYFSTNYMGNYSENNSILNLGIPISLASLKVKTKIDTTLMTIQQGELDKIRPNTLNTSIGNGAKHDRFIHTNSTIITLGNSLFKKTPCSYTQFPIGLYSDFFD